MIEKVERLEKNIARYLRKRRIIQFVVSCLLIVVLVLSMIGIDNISDSAFYGLFMFGMIVGLFGAIFGFSFLLTDLLYCRCATNKVNGYYVTAYKGMFSLIVYIDGEEKEKMAFIGYNHVIDTRLPDGVKMCISFSRSFLSICHISFSDNNSSIDLN